MYIFSQENAFQSFVWKMAAILSRPQCVNDPQRLSIIVWFMFCNAVYIKHLSVFSWILRVHDGVIKWKHFPRYWPFVRGIHRSQVNSPHKGQWRGALMFSLICARINGWVYNCEAGDLRRNRAHYDVIVMFDSWRIASGVWCLRTIFQNIVATLNASVQGSFARML